MNPRIIVTVDAEEEGLWSGDFRTTGNTAHNIQRVPPFQQICDDLGIAPVYLVNSPVVADPEAVRLLREIADDGRCEIGTHIHPWNTPPITAEYDARGSYLCNLPVEVQRDKLATVTAQIADAFGTAPLSFRAGRYGLDTAGARLLSELGYVVDSSVCPFTDYSSDGGPDFRGAPFTPYWIGEDLLRPGSPGGLLEVPVSFGFNRANFIAASRVDEFLRGSALRKLRVIGVLDRVRALQKIKFSPEKSDAGRLNRLADAYVRNAAPCMVMMFHSSSLSPGNTPYVRSEAELATFLSTMRASLEYCTGSLGMRPATLSGFAAEFASSAREAV